MFIILHSRLANTVFLYVLVMAVWGFWRFFRKLGVDSNYWGALVIAEVLILLQGALGIWLRLSDSIPARGWMHILYGIVGAIGIPAVYFYTKGQDENKDMLVYAAIFLFLIGIVARAVATGGAA